MLLLLLLQQRWRTCYVSRVVFAAGGCGAESRTVHSVMRVHDEGVEQLVGIDVSARRRRDGAASAATLTRIPRRPAAVDADDADDTAAADAADTDAADDAHSAADDGALGMRTGVNAAAAAGGAAVAGFHPLHLQTVGVNPEIGGLAFGSGCRRRLGRAAEGGKVKRR